MTSDDEQEDEQLSVESRIAPPSLTCPKCEGLLPSGLGVISCKLCDAEVKVDHALTRKSWLEEKIGCPKCNKVLIVGVDNRPCTLQCSSCESIFEVTANIPKVEITCPSCNRRMRMNKRPGERKISCPSCQDELIVKF